MSSPVMPGSLRWGFWLCIVVSGLLALSAVTIYTIGFIGGIPR